jgi:type VI secretion system protein ImpL
VKSAKNLLGGDDRPVIDQQAAGPAGPLDSTFGPLLQLMGKNSAQSVMAADSSLSLQTYLTRLTRVRLRLQQVANAADPQAMMQQLAQTVFQGKSVDLTDTQEYGSLVAASLGEEWSGFGQTMFVQPLTQAWETVLQPSAASLNEAWQRSVVANWNSAFKGVIPLLPRRATPRCRCWRRSSAAIPDVLTVSSARSWAAFCTGRAAPGWRTEPAARG